MPFSTANIKTKIVDGNLVEKILEQGQRLRNAIVQSIINNDPFGAEIINEKHCNTPRSSSDIHVENKHGNIASHEVKRIEKYLRGDWMSREEEQLALDTIRSMPPTDLYKTTENTLNFSPKPCICATCSNYSNDDIKCHLRRGENDKGSFKDQSQNSSSNKNCMLLQYVDSVKISIHSLLLNEAGFTKVFAGLDIKSRKFISFGQSYFLEYEIPQKLIKKHAKSKSKVDSGLDHNFVRICSRQDGEVIVFKQVFVHNIKLTDVNDCDIKFKISFRNQKLKRAVVLGTAKFNFSAFLTSPNLTCSKGLPVLLSEDNPICVGTLKIAIQLGADRVYFGQDFIDAVQLNVKDSIELDSSDSAKYFFVEKDISDEEPVRESEYKDPVIPKIDTVGNVPQERIRRVINDTQTKPQVIQTTPVDNQKQTRDCNADEKTILYGFIYIAEAEFLGVPINTFVRLKPFCESDFSYSRTIIKTSNPVYSFSQEVPLMYDEDLLMKFRENYMILEFCAKTHSETVIGLTKVPLHQFYIAYRNPILVKYLCSNKCPVISTDCWEPIFSTAGDEVVGRVQLLVALGTNEQIKNLKAERGFNDDIVKSRIIQEGASNKLQKNIPNLSRNIKHVDIQKVGVTDKAVNTTLSPIRKTQQNSKTFKCADKQKVSIADKAINTYYFPVQNNTERKVDVGIQSNLIPMENDDNKKPAQTQELLGSFFNQLLAERQRNIYVETGTNTEGNSEAPPTVPTTDCGVRKTSDLLDSLNKALSIDSRKQLPLEKTKFCAKVVIKSASQLPCRRKCKSKKAKKRTGKNDENVLPSTYVTFETMPGGIIKITPVVPRTASPKWDYESEVELPVDLLTDAQKRLIFKVWKKSTNTMMLPNMQTDMVLGFAALDLTVLSAGLPNIQGWFNIIDFSGKCNGQINIHITPLDDLSSYQQCKTEIRSSSALDDIYDAEEPGEILSKTLKRKFTELDEITQRLRLRLSEVTKEDSEASNDETDEFERDINTLCVEEDFDLINFDEEARKFNTNHTNKNSENKCEQSEDDSFLLVASSSNSQAATSKESSTSIESTKNSDSAPTIDKQLIEGKQKIDTLLEKLSLLNAESNLPFSSRYVSGCSASNEDVDTETVLEQLDKSSRPNIQSSLNFDPVMFQQLYSGSVYSPCASQGNSNSSCETSIISNNSNARAAPDGQGNTS